MHDYILSCCSTVDLTAKHLQDRNVSWLPFHFFLDEKEYFDDMFTKTMTPEDFYTAMAKGAMTRTSQVNATEYYDYFEKFVKEGKAIVHATLSSGLSGSYNSANTAVSMLKEKYPTCEIYVIDTLCASSGFGLFVDMLADARDNGMSAKELYEYFVSLVKKNNKINKVETGEFGAHMHVNVQNDGPINIIMDTDVIVKH